jgi:hypothetical protein
MANEKFDIFVNLRDRASAPLKRIGSAGLRMGSLIARGGRAGLRGLQGLFRRLTSLRSLLAGGAFVGAIATVTKAFWEQARANVSLGLAIARQGLSAKEVLPVFQAFAAEMQKLTTIGDETTQRIMALGMNMGISAGQIEEATKAAIGMSKGLEIDLQSAMKLVAKASAGQTSELSRYGIVLDQSLTSQEKFAKVLELGAGLFANATAETEQTYGAFQQMKNAAGDLQERIGEVIDRVFKLGDVFGRLRDWIASVKTAAFEQWLTKVRDNAVIAARAIGEIFKGGEDGAAAMQGFRLIVVGAFKSAAAAAVAILAKAAPAIGHAIGEAIDFGGARLGVKSTAKTVVMKQMLAEEEQRTGNKPHYLAHEGIKQSQEYKRRVADEFDKLWRMEMSDRGAKVVAGMDTGEGKRDFERGIEILEKKSGGDGEPAPPAPAEVPEPSGTETADKQFYSELAEKPLREQARMLSEHIAELKRVEKETPEGERGQVQLRLSRAGAARQAAVERMEADAADEASAREQMGETVWKARYEAADDDTKKGMLDQRGAELKKQYAEADWKDRPEIFEQWMAVGAERKSLGAGDDADADDDKTAALREKLAEMQRPKTQELGIREYFRYMQNLQQGKAPDEQTAANTCEMVRLLEQIARSEGIK